jgi:hypothetical protein
LPHLAHRSQDHRDPEPSFRYTDYSIHTTDKSAIIWYNGGNGPVPGSAQRNRRSIARPITIQAGEDATGHVFEIFTVVPDGSGGLQIAKDGVFSDYEFSWPISDRLTDQTWRKMLEEDAPNQPDWTNTFITQ